MTNTNDEKEIEFEIPIDQLYPKFVEHLEIENNSRILFSGKFGIGKTYFLNEFFEDKKDKYEVFHLFPINYQISSNEDIIEFLKYDILVKLNKNKDLFKKNDYMNFVDMQSLLYLWGKDNITEILKTSVSFIPKLGKPLKDTIGLTENFWNFKKELEAGDKGTIDKFISEIKKKNISETDYFSELLKEKITEVKGDKQSILILDDLDRIDPEHIFRILNIFSAHFDLQNSNKFSFDKIILVADYLNLRSIFHHKYGSETDFNGYFDKFFSVEVFEFNNEKMIEEYVGQIISKLLIDENHIIESKLRYVNDLYFLLNEILIESNKLHGKEKLNLRQFLKGIKFPIVVRKDSSYNFHEIQFNSTFQINIAIKILISIFGGVVVNLLSTLVKIRIEIKPNQKYKYSSTNYKSFSLFFLRKYKPQIEHDKKTSTEWENYFVSIDNNRINDILDINSKKEVNANIFFYDLLIEYIKENHYLQNN